MIYHNKNCEFKINKEKRLLTGKRFKKVIKILYNLNRIVLFDRGVILPLNRNVIVDIMRSGGPLDTHMVLPKRDQCPAALHDSPAQQLDLIGSQILFRFEAGNLPGTGGLSHCEYKFFGTAADGHF